MDINLNDIARMFVEMDKSLREISDSLLQLREGLAINNARFYDTLYAIKEDIELMNGLLSKRIGSS